MLRLTADVNGRPIGFVYIHNTGEFKHAEDGPGHVYEYDAAYWNPDRPLDSVFGIERVSHLRELGWMPLARGILIRLIERLT